MCQPHCESLRIFWHLDFGRQGSCLPKLVPIFEHKAAFQIIRGGTLTCCMRRGYTGAAVGATTTERVQDTSSSLSEEALTNEFGLPRRWQSYSFGRLLVHLSKAPGMQSLGFRTCRSAGTSCAGVTGVVLAGGSISETNAVMCGRCALRSDPSIKSCIPECVEKRKS